MGFKFKQTTGKKWKLRNGGQDAGSSVTGHVSLMGMFWPFQLCLCISTSWLLRGKVTLLTLLLIMMLAKANTDTPLQKL